MSGSADFRPDAWTKVTGKAKYSADINFQDMLYAKILWPKEVPSLIKKIDYAKASQLPGVIRIITRKDIKGTNLSGIFEPYDRPVLIGEGEKAAFMGDALAIVVAESEDIAAEAVKQIDIVYETLPGIYTLEDAIEKEEAFLCFNVDKGNVDDAFAKADLIVEENYRFPYVEHAYLEPEAGYSYVDGQDIINVCYGSQNLARHHRAICKALGLPYHKVRLFSPYVGGAFGGKHAISVQIYLALIASLVQKPTKLTWTREESFRGSKRHSIKAWGKMGFTKEGKLVAIDVNLYAATGPYMGYSDRTLKPAINGSVGPYDVDNVRVNGKGYRTNNVDITAFRGFGWTEGTMIIETLMAKAGKILEIEPDVLRKINIRPREKWTDYFPGFQSELHSRNTQEDTINKIINSVGPKPKLTNRKVGRGFASAMCTFEFGSTPGYRGTGADITMFSDGSVTVRIGFPEVGQGITAVITSLVSDFFSIPGEKVNIIYCDSHVTPKAGSLGASRGTVNGGNAVLDACTKLQGKLEGFAAEFLDTDEKIKFNKGAFFNGEIQVADFQEIMDYCYIQGKNLSASGWYEMNSKNEIKGFTFISGLVDLAVDEETGDIELLRVVNCHDAGKVIYYDGARGQMIGGSLMAIGGILQEEFIMDKGKPLTPSLAEYIIPTIKDIPNETIPLFIEEAGEYGPKGAKGLGEHVLHVVGPAIVNAIYDAIGVMVTDFPITPERLLRKMGKI